MATLTFSFYDIDPWTVFSRSSGGTATYTGPATAEGTATITDDAAGDAGATLEDSNRGETATADVSISGLTSTGTAVEAEESWTLRDTVTGETFELVTFRVTSGDATGYYTLSEIPLVAGRVYETIAYDNTPDVEAGDPVFTYADYDFPTPDGLVEGTAGDDTIDGSYTGDPDGDVVDGNDGATGPTTALEFNWTDYADETNLAGGVSQDTGGIQVGVSFSGPAGSEFSAEHTNALYTAGGEPFNPNSGVYLYQNGAAEDASVTFDFSATGGSDFESAVQDVSFRISDIDGLSDGTNNFQDIVTITAYDADGNEIPVTITPAGNVTVNGNVATGQLVNTSETQAQGSVLVEIAGPVSRIVINYDNGGDTQQAIFITDLHFQAAPLGSNDDTILAGDGNDVVDGQFGDDEVYGEAGDDTLTGGQGADLLDGGAGGDTLNTGSGDTALGGDGDDTFVIDGGALGGGMITITGGETGETLGDTLDFNGLLQAGSVVITNPDDAAGGKSGTATLIDGTVVTFSEIEAIICFVSGTLIDTPHGPRPVEALAPGDLVLTLDRGPQPVRWHGTRALRAGEDSAPVRLAPGVAGNPRPLLVSPQHRLLIRDHRAQLYFGEDEVLVPAKALVDGRDVTRAPAGPVTYHHLMFERHEIIFAEGAPTESYHPGAYSLDGLAASARDELFAVFPGLRADVGAYGPAARPAVRPAAARVLAA